MKDMDITEVSRRAGVPASTLRYHEEKGLAPSIGPFKAETVSVTRRKRKTGHVGRE